LVDKGRPERADRTERHERAKPTSALAELTAVREADRSVKVATRELKTQAAQVGAEGSQRSRKPAARRPAPRPRARR
jgi:hypothetical protein